MDEFKKKNYHFEHRDKKLCQKTYRSVRNSQFVILLRVVRYLPYKILPFLLIH